MNARNFWGLTLVPAVLSFSSIPATAFESLDFTIHQEYVSTRALGMGNAFTAVASDHSAIFYNPAALARREKGHLRMFIRAEADTKSFELLSDIDDAENQPTEDEKIDAMTDLIVSNYGEHYHYRLPTIGGMWVRPNWGIAFIPADLSIDIGIHQQIGPMLNVNAYLDSTLAYSYARSFDWFGEDHEFSLGGTVKTIHRVHVGEAIGVGELVGGSDVFDTSLANEGLTFDLDLGSMWSPPSKSGFFKYLKPTFAIVGRNLVDYGFAQNLHLIDPDSGEPPQLYRRFDFGSSWALPKLWVFYPLFAFDIRDVGHPNWTWKKGMHAGAELYWRMFSWWKGYWSVGINQGYLSSGVGARFAWFLFDFATYGEEVGTTSVPKENRRYMLELALDF